MLHMLMNIDLGTIPLPALGGYAITWAGGGRLVASPTCPGVAVVYYPNPPATQEVVGAHGDHLAGEVSLVLPVTIRLASPYS